MLFDSLQAGQSRDRSPVG